MFPSSTNKNHHQPTSHFFFFWKINPIQFAPKKSGAPNSSPFSSESFFSGFVFAQHEQVRCLRLYENPLRLHQRKSCFETCSRKSSFPQGRCFPTGFGVLLRPPPPLAPTSYTHRCMCCPLVKEKQQNALVVL